MVFATQIDVAVRGEAESFFNSNGSRRVLAHSEILDTILDALEPIDFLKVAGLESGDTIPQKHLLVMCVNELLAKVKE